MNEDYIINIISTVGDVKREFRLEDILRHNTSLLSLHSVVGCPLTVSY